MRSSRPPVLAFALVLLPIMVKAQMLTAPRGAQPFRKLPTPAVGAPPLAKSNSQGVALLQKCLTAITAQSPPTDVTLQGNITIKRPRGTTDTGTITLAAKGDTQAEITMNLTTGALTEIRSLLPGGAPAEMLTEADGQVTHNPVRSLLTPHPAWFFPQFVLAARPQSDMDSSFIAPETRVGVPVNHLQVWQRLGVSSVPDLQLQDKTQFDLYLDSATSLPVAMVYWMEPITPNDPPSPLHSQRQKSTDRNTLS